MTITFQGHVESMRVTVGGEVELTICTPMEPTSGKNFIVRVPAKDAQHWLPGRMVSFTVYALPEGVSASPGETPATQGDA